MRLTLPLLIAAALLSACGPELTPKEKADKALIEASFRNATIVTIKENEFTVGRDPEGPRALIKPTTKMGLFSNDDSFPTYFIRDVEAASNEATGCKSTFYLGWLADLAGDDADEFDLARIGSKRNRPVWSTFLEC